MNPVGRPRFSWRALTSLSTAISFVVMTVSGVFLFLAPSTRIARETNWQMWGLDKSEWQDLHLLFCALFVIVAVVHTVLNWRPLLGYLKKTTGERPALRWEWLVALLLAALFFAGARVKMQPFSIMLDWRERFHGGFCETTGSDQSGEKEKGGFGQKTLAQYCTEQGLPLDAAIARLQATGIKADGKDTLRQLADKSGRERPGEITRLLANP
ncbi:MAG: DUF4405 domain-containing protein [Verrucomicrobia bacterium]|nr:DUF4405 domain-containing protein [Verrucomicrobiota bacterium]